MPISGSVSRGSRGRVHISQTGGGSVQVYNAALVQSSICLVARSRMAQASVSIAIRDMFALAGVFFSIFTDLVFAVNEVTVRCFPTTNSMMFYR